MKDYLPRIGHSKAYKGFYFCFRATFRFFFRVLYRIEVRGAEKIPSAGRFILCSNHQSYVDPVIIGLFFPRYLYFMAKSELFKSRALAQIVTFLNAFPVKRGTFDRKAIRIAVRILEADEVVGIFPEGTRATDGMIKSAQRGIAMISLLSNSPVMPVAISGSNRIIRKPHKRLYFPKIKINYGEIIDTASIVAEHGSKAANEIIVSQAMNSVKALYSEIFIG